MPLIDLTGNKYNRLTVLYRDESKPKGNKKSAYWICKCDCGTIKSIRGDHLRNNKIQSCGCLQKERASDVNTIDLTGQKFGRLLVLSKVNKTNKHGPFWKCKCDCGNIVEVQGCYLRDGTTKSCGCLQKEQLKNARGKHKISYF